VIAARLARSIIEIFIFLSPFIYLRRPPPDLPPLDLPAELEDPLLGPEDPLLKLDELLKLDDPLLL
jgi:hypothetical protein